MPGGYSSFLIRCWSRGGFQHRLRVEHIQSGRSARVATFRAAEAWIQAQLEPARQPPDPDQDGATGPDRAEPQRRSPSHRPKPDECK